MLEIDIVLGGLDQDRCYWDSCNTALEHLDPEKTYSARVVSTPAAEYFEDEEYADEDPIVVLRLTEQTDDAASA